MHISAVCLPILSGAYCGCMRTLNEASFPSPLSVCLSFTPLTPHFSSLFSISLKVRLRIETHVFENNLSTYFQQKYQLAFSILKTPTIINFYSRKRFTNSCILERHRKDQLLFDMHKYNECNLWGIMCSLTLRIFPHSAKSLTNITTSLLAWFSLADQLTQAYLLSKQSRYKIIKGHFALKAWPWHRNTFKVCKHLFAVIHCCPDIEGNTIYGWGRPTTIN